MAVSAPDSFSQIPGFRDRLGERVIVPQQSGALLEFLHFSDPLAAAPFFAQAMKDRIGQLANFRHSSYCRVRRLQSVVERDGKPALVSAHVAGRRLSEVLDVASRTDLRPSTSGVLSVTRQLMSSVALLHDFAPFGFHGALGPERLILAGDGRVAVAEHVLGTLVEEAAKAWGAGRLWQDFRIPVLPEPSSAQYGRRVDVVQIGLVTLAMLLGRPLGAADYPSALPQLLGAVEETKPDGSHAPLRTPLRTWLERTLGLKPDSSFRALLEAQKAFAQLLQEEDYSASSVAWEAFVGVCETAALRVPVVVVAPDAPVPVDVAPPPASPAAGVPVGVVGPADAAVADLRLAVEPPPALEPVPLLPDSAPGGLHPADGAAAAGAPADLDPVTRLREDPFGPWPVATPAGSAATLLDSFQAPAAPLTGAAALAAATSEADKGPAAAWAAAIPAAASTPGPRAETLFEAPPVPVRPPEPPPPRAPQPQPWEQPGPPATSVADWRTRDRIHELSFEGSTERQAAETFDGTNDGDDFSTNVRARRTRILILVALAIVGAATAVAAPYAWKVVFEGRLVLGTLSVDSEPPGAVISIDGQVRGHTPADLSLKAGEHLLEMQVGGSATSKKIVIKANEILVEKMTFPEAGERGGLVITTYPAKGKVTVDGIPRGNAPLKITDLQPGTHTLVIETSYGTQEQDVVVQSGRVAQLSVPTVSWLKVAAPYELTVYENGRLIGTAGASPLMVAPGRRYLDFVNKSLGLKLRQFVDAVAGQVVTVPLELPTGMMNLYSDQPADVVVDGAVVGQTPLPSLQVPLGSHDVIFRHPTYGEVRYTVAVTLTAPVKLTVTFRK